MAGQQSCNTFETCATEGMSGASAVAAEVPFQHSPTAPVISRVWKQGDQNRGTEPPVEEAEEKKGMKKSNSVVSR